ncbi:apoptosis-inducing factor 3 [Cylas formicarius]|uniref:apoptosis-inducing factor 3 n=1 Tax=Cylas formicarius TaxID=197179 RepID=UPI0029587A5A|nr:apoptosis-inducing factor 3 [Cylas formicarius]
MGCGSSKIKDVDERGKAIHAGTDDDDDDFVEDVLCKVDDLKENEMKTFALDEQKVLVVKQNGKISALGTKCTHYGAPLVSGALGEGRVRCQWHGACFAFATGDIEDFPGLDSLPCYKVTIEDGNVRVRARRTELETNKRVKPMVRRDPNNEQSYVVVGGGPSGATCVETLRQEGFDGEITLVCRENYLPYDRVKVSKTMDFDITKAEFRDDKFYADNGITVLKGVSATAVDTADKFVALDNGDRVKYDKLFVATGCKPWKLDVPGSDLRNVVVLRDYEDSQYTIKQLAEDKEVVVVGASFIGMEAANYCVDKVKKVTVILRDTVPFRSMWGERIGAAVERVFRDKGVHFVNRNGIERVNDDGNGAVSEVVLRDGQVLKADLLVMGVGSTYYTDFLRGSGIGMQSDGSVETDEYLETNVYGVYAGGDIAYAPVWSHGNAKVAIGHYPLAQYHGRVAALNMLGRKVPLRAVPYFWTMLFGKGFRYAGHGKYDDIVYAGDVDKLKFVAFFLEKDEVVGAVSCGMDPVVSQFAERLSQDRKLLRQHLEADPLAWTKS